MMVMEKRWMLKKLLLTVIVLSLMLPPPFSALAAELETDDIILAEAAVTDANEPIPEIAYDLSEELFEEEEENQPEEAIATVADEMVDAATVEGEDPEVFETIEDLSDIVDEAVELPDGGDEIPPDDSTIDSFSEIQDDAEDQFTESNFIEIADELTIETMEAATDENGEELITDQTEEDQQILELVEEPFWSLSLPGSQPIAYKAERTEIGTISVQEASNFTDDQAISVTLDYSSFSSDTHSIPIEITVMQNGTERTWSDGTTITLSPDGSDPITVFVNISAEAWMVAPHGAYAMSLVFHSALVGR